MRVSADEATSQLAVCAAVIKTSAPDSVVAGMTAARLHGLWLPPGTDQDLHIATAEPGAVGRVMTRTRRPEIRPHRFQLDPDDVTALQGVPVTSPARTWLDLAPQLCLPDLVAAGDSTLRSGVSREQLGDVVARAGRRRGIRLARVALALLDERSRSRPESHLRVAISGPGLPRFDVNVPVHRDEGGWLTEPDLSLAEAKIAIEYQGEDHATVQRMRKDLTRFTDLRLEGWVTLAYGPAETFGRPWQVHAEVRRTVAERAPHLLPHPPRSRRTRPRTPSGQLRAEWSATRDHSARR
ncbi:hypothetical protein [uncultured Jatrophihabitans sp.]|uniref:hypothetical protein n=1 Tax=uncultured Jatrophihabitans sp. TaxID=1610747 RepID=UPI0035CA6097